MTLETILQSEHLISVLTITAGDRMDRTEVPQGTSMPTSPSPPPGGRTTLATVDIVVLVVYFVLVLAVGFWVSTVQGKADRRSLFQYLHQAF